jgi:hypothetical protein
VPLEVKSGIAAILMIASSLGPPAYAQTNRHESLANSSMAENRPTPETGKALRDHPRQGLVPVLPLLRAEGGVLRQELAAQ